MQPSSTSIIAFGMAGQQGRRRKNMQNIEYGKAELSCIIGIAE